MLRGLRHGDCISIDENGGSLYRLEATTPCLHPHVDNLARAYSVSMRTVRYARGPTRAASVHSAWLTNPTSATPLKPGILERRQACFGLRLGYCV